VQKGSAGLKLLVRSNPSKREYLCCSFNSFLWLTSSYNDQRYTKVFTIRGTFANATPRYSGLNSPTLPHRHPPAPHPSALPYHPLLIPILRFQTQLPHTRLCSTFHSLFLLPENLPFCLLHPTCLPDFPYQHRPAPNLRNLQLQTVLRPPHQPACPDGGSIHFALLTLYLIPARGCILRSFSPFPHFPSLMHTPTSLISKSQHPQISISRNALIPKSQYLNPHHLQLLSFYHLLIMFVPLPLHPEKRERRAVAALVPIKTPLKSFLWQKLVR
jgi:hypothetical protein